MRQGILDDCGGDRWTASDLDPRRHAYRADLADERLRGKVEAARFVAGRAPSRGARLGRPAPPARCRARLRHRAAVRRDRHACSTPPTAGPGCRPSATAMSATCRPTRSTPRSCAADAPRVGARHVPLRQRRHQIAAADAPVDQRAAGGGRDRRTGSAGWRPAASSIARHVAPLGQGRARFRRRRRAADRRAVSVGRAHARRPRLLGPRAAGDGGGRPRRARATATCRQAEVGDNLLVPDALDGLRRGDLVFWPGHVGIMVDGVMLLHANAHHMAVVVEPLSAAVQRIGKTGGEIRAHQAARRLEREPGAGRAAASTDGQAA